MVHFSSLQKKLLIVISILLVFVLTLDTVVYRAFFVNPYSFRITYKTIRNEKIPDSMNQVSMVYCSDLEYGSFSDQEQTDRIFSEIQGLNPDIFVYGGDLFASDNEFGDDQKDQMNAWLSSIEAPLGKFAVWGEQDVTSEERMQQISEIYQTSQIEVLDNTSRLLANQSRSGIRLVGLGLNPDAEAAFGSVAPEQYSLVVSHYPDNLTNDAVSVRNVSYALAGNAHGTQITWPIKGGYRLWPGSEKLNRADQKRLNFPYYLTSGIGCINVHARLNAPVEIVYILFTNMTS